MSRITALILSLATLGINNASAAEDTKTFASFIDLPWRYVIGGSTQGQWLNSEATGKRLSALKTTYRVFTLEGEVKQVTAGKATPEADVCPDVWMLNVTPEPDLEKPAIGVNAVWNPMPRIAKPTHTTQEVYVSAVRELLTSKGLKKPNIKITQLLRVDLEGDGEDEVLLAATHYANAAELISPKAGDYSFVALRRVVKGKVLTQLIESEFYPKSDESAAPNVFDIGGLLDLDGDGKLEVIVHSHYYEGGGTTVWQMQQGKLAKVLEIFCGA